MNITHNNYNTEKKRNESTNLKKSHNTTETLNKVGVRSHS